MARRGKKGPPSRPKPEEGLPYRNHHIPLEKAIEYTRRWREAAPRAEKGGLFDAGQVRDLLSQKGCEGFRYYHGLDADGRYHIILVGVDAKGEDILPPRRGEKIPQPPRTGDQLQQQGAATVMALAITSGGGVILEDHWECPVVCPKRSSLV
jgi:hypothetical protein